MTPPRRRERHGRGPRGALLPQVVQVGRFEVAVPAWKSGSDRLADLVQHELRTLGATWAAQLDGLRVDIQDVPPILDGGASDDGVIRDGAEGHGVPLARTRPGLLVVYRRPLELRGQESEDLRDLVHDVVFEAVAVLLGVDPDELEPPQG